MTTVSVKKNFIFSFSEKVLRAALSFVSLGIVARYLGPEQYGVLSYLLALITYFQLLGAFGLDQVLMRLFIGQYSRMEETYWETVIFKIFFSFISIIIYLSFLIYNNEANVTSILFGIAILASVFDNNRIYLESKNRHHIVAKIEIFYQVFSSLFKIILCTFDMGTSLIFSLFVIDFFVTKVVMFIAIKSDVIPLKKIDINFQRFKFYFNAGGFHCLSAIFIILYMKIDQVIVGRMMGMNALGNYSAAVRLSDAWYFLPMTVSSVFYPMALIHQKDKENRHLQIIFDLTFLISLVVIGIALIFSDEIFYLMFGNRFIVNKLLLNLLFYSGFFITLCVSTAAWLNVKGDKKIMFLRSLIGAVTNIGLTIYLIPDYGLVGCGFATLTSYMITFLITFIHSESKDCRDYIFRSLNIHKMLQRLYSATRSI